MGMLELLTEIQYRDSVIVLKYRVAGCSSISRVPMARQPGKCPTERQPGRGLPADPRPPGHGPPLTQALLEVSAVMRPLLPNPASLEWKILRNALLAVNFSSSAWI